MLLPSVLAWALLGFVPSQGPGETSALDADGAGYVGEESKPLGLDERNYSPELVREIAKLVRRARDPKAPERPQLAEALGKLGSPAFEPLLDLLELRKVPSTREGQKPQTLSVYQEEVVVEALRTFGAQNVLRKLERRLASHANQPRRRAALVLYGRLGDRTHIDELFTLAAPTVERSSASLDESPKLEVDDVLEETLRNSLAEILRREPLAVPRLNSTWRSLPQPLLQTAIFAVGDVRDGRGLALAVDAAFAHPELLPLSAAQIAVIGRSPDVSVNVRAIEFLHTSRDKASAHVACAIERALAVLEDEDSVQTWIEQLGADDAALRSAAHWSLQHVSKLEYAPLADTWQVWWNAEREWFDRNYDRLLGDLAKPNPSVVASALRELANRRTRRHEIAVEIARLLEASRPTIRKLACEALAELGSIDVLPELTRALRDEDEGVANAAWRALSGLSGRHFALDSVEWDELVAAREP
ncbi:MAG: HEAT repeat domain-containing protein [Planctomycetes bacterium]|nr:HEAT repeat domain-containing protein [Planctomycetota bacterium]